MKVENELRVLMVGSSTNVKGGMTTVVESFLTHTFAQPIMLDYIPTHTEKGKGYNLVFFAISLLRIIGYFIFKRPRIVHMHMSERGSFIRKYVIFKLSKLFGKKVIVHTHGAEFKEYYLSASLKIKRRILNLLSSADKVIALGHSWESILRDIEPKANVTVLRNAVQMPIINNKKTVNQPFMILFLAVLIERKGILDLIEAAKPVVEAARKQNRTVCFQIAGDGELLEAAKELVASLELEAEFDFLGWVGKAEKEQLLKEADLFVLPSYNEGLPMSILEAMSYGIPVISTAVGSIDEAVVEGVTGYLIPPGDRSALTARLLAAMFNPEFEEMKRASRKRAEEKFNSELYFEQVEQLYMNEA